jgi:recombinational DNA repair ATPase RecF
MALQTRLGDLADALPDDVPVLIGAPVARRRFLDELVDEIESPIRGDLIANLIQIIKDDKRKTFSKAKLLELIDEHFGDE